jgi:hypothetical protein
VPTEDELRAARYLAAPEYLRTLIDAEDSFNMYVEFMYRVPERTRDDVLTAVSYLETACRWLREAHDLGVAHFTTS